MVVESDVNVLKREVNDLIKNGFQPHGSVSSTYDSVGTVIHWSQPMVKIETT
jgi:hypothetical protein